MRGAIWFVAWGILFFALTLFYPILELEVTVQPDPGSDKTSVYMLAVGAGGARSIEDPVATSDLQTLTLCMQDGKPVDYSLVHTRTSLKYVHDA